MYNSSIPRTSLSREVRNLQNQNDLYASLGLDLESNRKKVKTQKRFTTDIPISMTKIWKIFAYSVIFLYICTSVFRLSPAKFTHVTGAVSSKLDFRPEEDSEDLQYIEPEPKYYRNVILDLPVSDDDVPILLTSLWSDSDGIRDAYDNCYDTQINEQQGVGDFISYGRLKVFHTTQLDILDDLVTPERQGRMFAFFRHPFHDYLEQIQSGGGLNAQQEDNPMARIIAGGNIIGDLTFKDLGEAKRALRERFVIGLLDDNMMESFHRIADYFGWSETGGPMCITRFLSTVKSDHFGEMMHDNSEQWENFLVTNKYDLQLYEYARSLFRGQKQTIMSLEKQKLYKQG